jgi:hypothetical protein
MERAPFGWNQPADFDDDWRVETERPAQAEILAQTDRALTSESPLADFDDEWPVETERLEQQTEISAQTDRALASESRADPNRPAYSELPLNFERYHAAYQAEERWHDHKPKLGRNPRIAYVLFAVALVIAGVWMIQGYLQEPVAPEEASQTSKDPPPRARAATPPSPELGLGTPLQGVDALPGTTAKEDLPPAPKAAPSLPGGSLEAGGSRDQSVPDTSALLPRTFEPPPLKGQTVDPGTETGKPTPPPPVRRPLVIAPPPRPPYQPTFGESAPPRAATTEPAPAPAPVQIPAPIQTPAAVPTPTTSLPSAETAPSSPRVAAPETVPRPLPRTAVEEPALASPATPPPAAVATPPPTTTSSPAASAPTTTARAPAAEVDSGAIRDVLGRYRSAFNTLDAKAAQQVWPSVNQRTLDRAFGQLEQQNVSFDTCTIYVKGVLAEANCRGTTRFVPRVGNRSTQVESRQWSFSLRKATGGGWLIEDVQAR